jgi:parvulin-like peptidyl-prolyl isomerase
MRKILFLLVPFYLFASLINGISVTVENEPITLIDVDDTMTLYKVDKNQALDILIRQKLESIEADKLGISVSDYDAYNSARKVASSEGMTYEQIKAIASKQYGSFDNYIELTKKNILKEQLYRKITSKKITNATDEDMKIYYENNKELFNIASTIEVVEYFSSNPNSLNEAKNSPLFNIDGVQKQTKTYAQDSMNSNQKYILNSLKVGEFSAVIPVQNGYMMSYIKNKGGITSLSFVGVKDKIYSILMNQRQENIVKEYFDRLQLNSEISIIR